MKISSKLDQLHLKVRENKWLFYFAIFLRIALAAGFLPSGFVKIMGERFTALSAFHPMGNYLEALHHTGFYYPFIGVMQMTAAILLLIPRTATLGAVIYFPIILNICILTLGVRFEGALVSSTLMVLACLYLLCWDYHKLKFIFPFRANSQVLIIPPKPRSDSKFPFLFFAGSFSFMVLLVIVIKNSYAIEPHNTLADCQSQCPDNDKPGACYEFCDCIHNYGQPLEKCLENYDQAPEQNLTSAPQVSNNTSAKALHLKLTRVHL